MEKIRISQKSSAIAGAAAKGLLRSLVTWSWTKRLLNWIILSAGTASELAFLAASIWMSVNANVHLFVLNFLTEQQTVNLSSLATIAYIALPECIVFLAVQTTLSHLILAIYHRKDGEMLAVESIWTVLFGLPALLFIVLSLITLSLSVQHQTVNLPDWAISLRAIGGYEYAFAAFLFVGNGAPKIKKEMAKRDQTIMQLREEHDEALQKLTKEKDAMIDELQKQLVFLNDKIENQNMVLSHLKKQEQELLNEVNKSSEMALEVYGEECINWLKSGIKTANADDITRYTGHSKRKIENAIKRELLKVSTRNSELILIDSLIQWLKEVVPLNKKTGEHPTPILHIVNE